MFCSENEVKMKVKHNTSTHPSLARTSQMFPPNCNGAREDNSETSWKGRKPEIFDEIIVDWHIFCCLCNGHSPPFFTCYENINLVHFLLGDHTVQHRPDISCLLFSRSVVSYSLWPHECSMPGFHVLHYLPELAQTQVYWTGDAIQPSHPLPW